MKTNILDLSLNGQGKLLLERIRKSIRDIRECIDIYRIYYAPGSFTVDDNRRQLHTVEGELVLLEAETTLYGYTRTRSASHRALHGSYLDLKRRINLRAKESWSDTQGWESE